MKSRLDIDGGLWSARRLGGWRRGGFTLAELMVAVVVLVILLGIVAMIYKSSADAVSHTNSTVAAIDKLDAFRRQVEDDLRHVCRDGYMVLVRREFDDLTEATPAGQVKDEGIDGVRADKLIFWRTGAELRPGGESTAVSNLAMVVYGHAEFSGDGVAYGQTPADGTTVSPVYVNRWAFGRRMFVHQYYNPATVNPANWNTEVIPLIRDSDVIPFTLADFKRRYLPAGLQMRNWFKEILEGGGPTDREYAIEVSDPARDLYRVLLDGCGSLSIRFLLPSEDFNHDNEAREDPNYDETDKMNRWPPDNGDDILDENIWLELPEPDRWLTPRDSLADVILAEHGIITFTPTVSCPYWPSALEFTIRLYDRELSIRSQSELDEAVNADGNGFEHSGLTYRFVVPVGG